MLNNTSCTLAIWIYLILLWFPYGREAWVSIVRYYCRSGSMSIIRLGWTKAAAEQSQHALLHTVVVDLHPSFLPSFLLPLAWANNRTQWKAKPETIEHLCFNWARQSWVMSPLIDAIRQRSWSLFILVAAKEVAIRAWDAGPSLGMWPQTRKRNEKAHQLIFVPWMVDASVGLPSISLF